MVYIVESYIFIFSAFFWFTSDCSGFRLQTLVARSVLHMMIFVFFWLPVSKIQVKTSMADLIVRKTQSDRLGFWVLSRRPKKTEFLSFANDSNGLGASFEVEHMALASQQLIAQRISCVNQRGSCSSCVNLPSCSVPRGMIRSALRCRKQKVRKKLIGRGPFPSMWFFTERFRQIEMSNDEQLSCCSGAVRWNKTADPLQTSGVFGLWSWNLQSFGRSMLRIDSDLW